MTNDRIVVMSGRGQRARYRRATWALLAATAVANAAACRDFSFDDRQGAGGGSGNGGAGAGSSAGGAADADALSGGQPGAGEAGSENPPAAGGLGGISSLSDGGSGQANVSGQTGDGQSNSAGAAGAGLGPGLDPAISPTSLSGLSLWLESSETSIEAVGGRVSTWKDTSGKGNDATEFDTALQPLLLPGALHGKAAVGFDGNPSNLVVPDEPSLQFGTQPFTVAFVGEWHNTATPTLVDGTKVTYPGYGFIITKVIGGTPYTGVAISANAAAPFANVQAQRRLGVQLEIGTANMTSSAFDLNDGVFRLYVVQRSAPGRVEIRINGVGQTPYDVPEGLDVSAFGHSLCLGGYLSNQLLGSLAEVVMVKGPLTGAELHGLERYLIDKFGL